MTREYVRYNICLSDEDREKLRSFSSKGNNPAMIVRRANVILAVDKNSEKPLSCKDAASVFGLHPTAITNIKREFLASKSIEEFLHRKVRETPPREIKITGDVEAHIIAISCQDPPEGHCRWTLELIANRVVSLGYIDSISKTSVSNVLKKTSSNRT